MINVPYTTVSGKMSVVKIYCTLLLVLLACVLPFVPEAGAIEYEYPGNKKVLVFAPSYTYGGEDNDEGLQYIFDESDDLFNKAKFLDNREQSTID